MEIQKLVKSGGDLDQALEEVPWLRVVERQMSSQTSWES